MSQSPTDTADAEQMRRYLAGWTALRRLIDEGKSISGRERHCCFLNVGNSRFANVSAVTGLDFIDDGRAVGLVDWDHDGDVDIWITNRTSPAVRFLRNDFNTGNHFVSLRLVGRDCNRDAIGARVELYTGSDKRPSAVKTLRAGNGFLAQSSKWLIFGLRKVEQIDRVVVHWPGGKAETFRGLDVDARFQLVQGSGQPVREPTRKRVEWVSSEPPTPPTGSAFRIVT
ncbi:MAG: ASPIC/UnbV domain-containing protein, partial [Planctomycetes bacterium]|nr:ASPIC/UnbV domain-containing protein [Planctomycetota bacterium]